VNYGFAFWITDGSGNIITANSITFYNPGVFTTDFGGFQVYHNNFINHRTNYMNTNDTMDILFADKNASVATLPPWDNGYPSGGNYWSDYTSKYPNATEIGNSGIGNTPYVVSTSPNVLDRYPLLSPINISQTTLEYPLTTSSPTPTNSPTPTAQPSRTTPSPTAIPINTTPSPAGEATLPLIIGVVATFVVIATVIFLMFQKRGKTSR
jgi:hypothetical protein